MVKDKIYDLKEAKKALERYCAYQERCHSDCVKKLNGMRKTSNFNDLVIGHLIQENFLNEQRFADAFVRGKFRIKKWGRRRLISELRSRHISNFAIKHALEQIKEHEYINTFEELAQKKFKGLENQPKIKQKRKLADFLLYRGWESHLVYDKINQLIK